MSDWDKQLEERMDKFSKDNPHWTQDKVRFVAMSDMPKKNNDGWEE